jgi:putative heme iron utilization protein
MNTATNLAYVRYFAKIDEATKATFKSIDSQKFTVDYELRDGSKGQVSIPFETPLSKREEIRPVLEAMAKEAETALGLVSIFNIFVYVQKEKGMNSKIN